ncbi:MAG: M48 family metalloprotease, partial [Acidobacteria bacterium]|nr:M48 family metalloprotease [Acidobacteriota bacterium]
TNGCNWQQVSLSLASIGGDVYEAKTGNANKVVTENDLTKLDTYIESQFRSQPDTTGYASYAWFSTAINRPIGVQGPPIPTDKLFGANRSIPVTQADFQFVSRIIERLRAGKYRVTNFKWTIVPTTQINSSSFPNPPFVFVYSSMLDFLNRNPDEMAFVIGHEIGHTIDANTCSGSGVATNASFGIPLIQDQWWKFCENHADNIGLQLMSGAGYNPRAAITVFQKLEALQLKQGVPDMKDFFGNHPLNSSRIKNVEKLLPIIEKQVGKLGE